MLDSHEKNREHLNKNGSLLRNVHCVEGTRSVHLTSTAKLPFPFEARVFHSWLTWDVRQDSDGVKMYVIALAPLDEYQGLRYRSQSKVHVKEALSVALYLFRAIGENVCEFTR